jgi:beta-glucosidase
MFKAALVEKHLVQAHCEAYRWVHKIYKALRLPQPAVSIAQNVMAFVPRGQTVQNKVAAYVRGIVYNLGFIERIMRKNVLRRKPLDFIGVNYYSRQMVEFGRFGAENGAAGPVSGKKSRIKQNSLGWDIYPQGIYDVLLALKKYRLPLMVTENGICTADDDQRWKYIRDHLTNVHRAMQKGAKVMGYMYWSLMDNFEWDKGFAPRFGLIDINYKTQRRTIRKSARKYAQVCKTGILTG